VILGILAVTALANAQTASLSLGSGAGTPGSNVALNLALAAAGTQAAAVQWIVQYSTSEITGVSASIFGASRSLEAYQLAGVKNTLLVRTRMFGRLQAGLH